MDYRTAAESIFNAGVERVLPDRLIRSSLSVDGNVLKINDTSLDLELFDNIHVIGAGKASALMGSELEKILGDKITDGHIVVKYGHSCPLSRIKITEAGHPVPDEKGFKATREITGICRKADERDLIICLISGGGSALMSDVPASIPSESLMRLNDLLVKSGASITEINYVRKHLSSVKGGQLARLVYPATLISLILSDVIGDPLDVIASGPTVPDPSTYQDALEVLAKYKLISTIPEEMTEYLENGKNGIWHETPKSGDEIFSRVYNILIGTNSIALAASAEKAKSLGLNPFIIDDRISDDILLTANQIVGEALKCRRNVNIRKPACLLFGGEPVVRIEGSGSGGRNQHLALLCAVMIREADGITILSAGTDGSDGPTNAAGAVVDRNTFSRAVRNGNDPEPYLKEFNSYNFFRKEGGHVITGPTMTNVMDIIVVLVEN